MQHHDVILFFHSSDRYEFQHHCRILLAVAQRSRQTVKAHQIIHWSHMAVNPSRFCRDYFWATQRTAKI